MLGGAAGRFCTPSTSAGPFRIFAVAGFQNRTNDIVYCPPIIRQINQNDDDATAIIYFGGDVQDFPESMETNRDSRGYMKYNLENSAVLLRNAFPRSHIVVVRPVRMEFKTFSCFDNFVRGNNAGVPDHTPMNHALQHLEKLLQNLSHRLISMPENELLAQVAASSSLDTAVANDNQDIDIDILQVQDNVTAEPDGSMIFNESNHATTSSPPQQILGHPINPSASQSSSSSTTTSHSEIAREHSTNNEANPTSLQFSTTANDCHQNLLQIQNRNPLWWRENINLDKAKLILIGFSKGCVVLNQFIYEFHYLKTLTPDDSTMIRLLSRIKDMYWLDGGHGGQKNTWITSRSLLETLTRMGMNIHVHVTPYQVQDDRRPWIRKEEKIFSDLLRRLGATISRHIHFENTTPNLVTHFEVLQAFCQHIHIFNQQQLQHHHIQQQQQQHQQQQQQQQQQHQQQLNRSIEDNCSSEK